MSLTCKGVMYTFKLKKERPFSNVPLSENESKNYMPKGGGIFMEIKYDYQKMLERAETIRREAPALLEKNDWDNIQRILEISDEYWRGPAAESYRGLVDSIMKDKSDKAAVLVLRVPSIIEDNVARMKERDHAVAQMVRQRFGV